MKSIKVIAMALLLAVFSANLSYANLVASDYTDYPYGIQLAYSTSYMGSLNMQWANYKNYFVTTNGCPVGASRVQMKSGDPYPNQTVSEGMAYGMLLAVYFNDKATFDSLWAYVQWSFAKNPNQLMPWRLDASGNVACAGCENAATDADEDVAFALIQAQKRWGGTYGTQASTYINKIATRLIAGDSSVKPGDAFDDYEYPSYYMPAWYDAFGTQTGFTSFWANVKTKCEQQLASARNNTNGFVDETITNAGARRYDNYKYNSCRVPWRYATDYVWNGTTFSGGQIQRQASFFNNVAVSAVRDCYDVANGNTCGNFNNGAFVGPSGTAFMYSSTYSAKLQEYYDAMESKILSNEYYNSSLALLSMLLIAGFFPEDWTGGGTPVNTPTFTATIPGGGPGPGIADDFADCDNGNYWGGFWYTYRDNGDGGTSVVWPGAGVTFTASSPGQAGAGDCAARMTGVVTTAFTFGYVGMGMGILATSGSPTYATHDFSSCTSIRFYAKGDGKSYSIKLKAAPSVDTGYNDFKYTFLTSSSWALMEVTMAQFTQEAGWGTVVPRTTVLAALTDVQFQTVSQPHASIDLWIDNLEFVGCSSYPAPLATATPSGPTNTPTNSPTPTITNTPGGPTNTPTNTPVANAGMLDDAADCNNQTNWGGYWYTYDDVSGNAGTSVVWPVSASINPLAEFVMSSPGYRGAADCAMRITGSVTTAYTYGFIGMGVSVVDGAGSPTYITTDLSSCTGVRFYAKGDGKQYSIKLKAAPSVDTGFNDYKYNFLTSASWMQVDILMTQFTQEAGWGVVVPRATVLAALTDVQFQTVSQPHASIDLWVDELEFYGCSSYPTPPVVATDTPTGPTNTPTFTNTPTITNTPGGPTNTPTNTPAANAGMFDDAADCNNQTNWGGYWYTYDDVSGNAGTSVVWPVSASINPLAEFVMSSPGYRGAADCAMRMTGVVTTAYTYGFIGMGASVVDGAGSPTYITTDMSSCTGVRFYAKGDGKQYSIKLKAAPSIDTGSNDYKYNFLTSASWMQVDILMTQFTQEAGWGIVVPRATVLAALTDVQFQTVSQPHASIDLWVDELEFYGCSSYPTMAPTTGATDTPVVATPTFTNTPTITNTPPPGATDTFTPTPGVSNPGMFDDAADCNNQTNWGGYWYTYDDVSGNAGTSVVWPVSASINPLAEFVMSSPGYRGAADCAMRITGVVTTAYTYGFIGMGASVVDGAGSPTYITTDLSSCTGVRFYAKGDGKQYSIKLKAAPSVDTGFNDYKYNFLTSASWMQVDILMTQFTQEAGWGVVVPRATVLAALTDVQFQTVGQPHASIDLWIDELEFYGCSSYPTLVPTTGATNTPVPPTFTPTNTNTPTITNTPPPGATDTFTPTPSNTPAANAGMLDDAADCNNQSNWGGYWYTYDDRTGNPGTSIVWPASEAVQPGAEFIMSSPGYAGAADCAMRITGVVTTAFTYGFVGMGISIVDGAGAPTYITTDMSSCTGIRFYAKGDGKQYSIKLKAAPSVVTGDNDYKYNFLTSASWMQVDLLLTQFTQEAGWGTVVPRATVLANLTDVQFQTVSQPHASIDLWIDNLEFYGCASYPTMAPTTGATNTPAVTATFTNTPTMTNTPPPGSTNTFTPTATNTAPVLDTPVVGPGMFDHAADCDNQTNWGGYWYTYDDRSGNPGQSIVWPPSAAVLPGAEFTMSSPGYRGGTDCAMRITGVVTTDYTYGFVGMGASIVDGAGSPTFTTTDMSSCTGVRFYAKGDGKQYSIKLKAAPSVDTGSNDYKYNFLTSTSWTQMDLLMTQFTQEAGWGTVVPRATVLAALTDVQFQTVGQPHASIDLWIDELEFYGCTSYPTPGATVGGPTNTPTNTATVPWGSTATHTPTQPAATPTEGRVLEIPTQTPVIMFPNPPVLSDGTVAPVIGIQFGLTKHAYAVKFKMYSPSMRLIREKTVYNDFYAGIRNITIPSDILKGLSAGTYYYVVEAYGEGSAVARSGVNKIRIIKPIE